MIDTTKLLAITLTNDYDNLYSRVARLFSKKKNRKEYLEDVVDFIKDWSQCNFVGVRVLDDEGNIPYEANRGFSSDAQDDECWLSLNSSSCFCIQVFKNQFSKISNKNKTEYGSFYCEDLRKWSQDISPKDLANMKGVCIAKQFTSFGLIPIKNHGEVLALIHLADFVPNKVTDLLIMTLEGIAPIIGEAIYRFNVEEELKNNYNVQSVVNSLLQLSLEDMDLNRLLEKTIHLLFNIPWIGFQSKGCIYLADSEKKELTMVAHQGLEEWEKTACKKVPYGSCICGKVADEKKILFVNKLDERHTFFTKTSVPHGHYCTPILYKNEIIGVINVYLKAGHNYKHSEVQFLTTVSNTLAGIIQRKKNESNLKNSLEQLEKTFKSSVLALTSALEKRDPYTYGHQARVAQLATAIASELNLPADQVEGVQAAAILHDIGKISVPTEFLTKPGVLKAVEFDVIKTHSENGHDILKHIEFPWPVAEITYQHHERINGSGYPLGLSGENILIQSRILAVADVVEAMSSHRPYRQALGVQAALDEIESHKGILYDSAVVDACLKLFYEKGFQFI